MSLLHPEDRVRVEAETSGFLGQGDTYAHEFRIVRPDGEIRHIHDRGTVERGTDGRALVIRGVNVDVSGFRDETGDLAAARRTIWELIEQSPFGIYTVNTDFRIVQVSLGAQKVFQNVRPLIGRDLAEALRILWPEPFASEAIGRFRHTLATGEPYHSPSTVETRHDSGEVESYDWKIERFILTDGRPGVVCHFYDLSERLRQEMAIRESERQLRLLIDNSVALIAVLDEDGCVIEVNAAALEAGGLSRSDVIGRPIWETDWWSYDRKVADGIREGVAMVIGGEVVAADEVIRTAGDGRMTIHYMLSPILGEDGAIRRIVVSGFDVTERKKAEENVWLLVREVNHRSKNIYSLLQAIARQTQQSDPEHFFEKFHERLSALAAAQDLLISGTEAGGVAVEELIKTQLAHFGDSLDHQIDLEGPPLQISPEAAQLLGMACHELGTNAAKYGSLSRSNGRVRVAWEVNDNRFGIEWSESDGPAVIPPRRSGFGSVVLGRLSESTLGAETELQYHRQGVRWRLGCPLPSIVPQPEPE